MNNTLDAMKRACMETTRRCEQLRQTERENNGELDNRKRRLQVANLELHAAMGDGESEAKIKMIREEMADHLRRIKECTDHAEDVAGALATAEKRAKEAQDALTEYRRTEILPRYEMRLGALERELTKAAARVAVARGTVIGLSPFRITVEDYVRRSRHNAESYALVVDQVEKELTAELER